MYCMYNTYIQYTRPPLHGDTTAPQRPSNPVPQHSLTPQLSAKEIRRGAARSLQGRADRADSPGWKGTRLTSYERTSLPPLHSFDSTYRISHIPPHRTIHPFQIYTTHDRTEMTAFSRPPLRFPPLRHHKEQTRRQNNRYTK